MKNIRTLPIALALLITAATSANAGCYADYKAKRDNPLRLHYGVIELSDQTCRKRSRAPAEVSTHLAQNDWQLLNIVSVFEEDGLSERRQSAGEYFLRY